MKTRIFLRLCFLLLLGLTGVKGYSQCANPTVSIDTVVTRPLCYGTSTASIQVNITGGLPPFTYSLYSDTIPDQTVSINSNSYTFTDLPPGTYLIATQVTLPIGFTFCTKGPIFISSPPAISITPAITDVSCNGESTGAIDISIAGGTPPYNNFNWNTTPPSSTEDISNLAAGSYTVTFTDANNCPATATFDVNEPTPLTITPDIEHVTCSGDNNGSIDLSVSGGTAPYTYAWVSPVSNASSISGLAGGAYTVTVTDGNGCEETVSYNVNEPAALSLSASIGDATCPGLSDGTIDLSVSGGTAPYTYTWNTGASSQDLSGLPSGPYTVTVRDANGCEETSIFNVNEPAPLVITPTITDVSCPGGSDGAISVVVSDGTPGYTYSWNTLPPSSSDNISGLPSGSYTVTVTDANLCTRDATFDVNEPAPITISGNVVDASCLGVNDGAIDLTINGGTAPYSYSWDNGAVSEDLAGLAGGSYTVTVTDAHNCEETETFNIVQPPALTLTENITHVDCNGNGNGAIDLTVAGGSAPYTYSWNTTPVSNTEDISGLDGGSYTVTVTDNNGCSQDATYNVNEPALLTVSGSQTDVTCNGGNNGAIDLTVNGGTAPYTFNWSNGANSEDISGLTATNYSVTVTDANNCTQNANFSINEPPAININGSIDDVNCNGGNDGSIDITINNGVAPFDFTWSTGETTEDIAGLAAGSYTVTVTDANNCSQNATFDVNEPSVLSLSETITDASCLGVNDGAIDLTVNGGTAPYSYSWDNGAVSEDLAGLAGGSYAVTVTDANNCEVNGTYNVAQPPALTLTENITHVDCNGNGNGAIDLTVAGGSAPYTYTWNTTPVSNTEDISGLDGGSYTVTVTDNNGCSQDATYNVNEPALLTVSGSQTDVTCNGGNNGAIDLTVNGGTAPYTFNWSNGANSEDISGLTATNYSVTVTDANNCTQNANFTINEPPAISINSSIDDVNCNGGNDGSIDITVNNGVAPFDFTWSTGETTEDIAGLAAGSYTVTVTDANNCSQNATFDVTEPTALTVSGNAVNILCNSGTTGSIDLTVNGGTAPYTFDWSNGAATEDLAGLAVGNYSVIVTDANNCTQNANFDITEPTSIDITTTSVTHVLCNGGSNGAIDVTVSGGTAPYTYSWDNGETSEDLSGIAANTYTLTVTDANGCTQMASIAVDEPAAITITDNTVDASCMGINNGSIDITVNGGIAPYSYSWDNGPTSEDLSNLAGGSYTVTVTDANNCTQNATYNIAQPASITLSGVETDLICNGTTIGAVDLTVAGGTAPYDFDWSNNESSEDLNNLGGGVYSVTVTDAAGCTANASFTIDEPAAMTLSGNVTNALCGGVNDGSIDLTVAGGTPAYTYSWSNGEGSEDITGLADGSYTVTVTDANGCSQDASFDVTVTLTFDLTIIVSTPLCNGNTNGVIDVSNVTGGVAPYTYSFNGGAYGPTNVFNNLAAGDYTISVRDASGCQQDSIVAVTEPAVLDLVATFDSPICSYGNNGEVTLTGNGGTPVYLFSEDNLTYSSQNVYTDLNPGTYKYYILDGNGCRDSVNATLTAFPEVNISAINATVKHLTCNNVNNGEIKLSNITGGTRPFTFSLNGGAPKADSNFLFLPAGTHVITITDANGCSYVYDTALTQPQRIQFSLDILKLETCENKDGEFALSTVTGGLAPFSYSYSFNNGPVIPYPGDTVKFGSLASGIYTIQVFDNNVANCSSISSIPLPKKPGPTPFIRLSDVNCPDGSDGMVIIDSLEGGVAPFNITLADTLGYSHTLTNVGSNDSVAFTGLWPHLYGMTIQDNECTYPTNLFYIFDADSAKYDTVFTDSLLITEPSPIGDSITTFKTDRHNSVGKAIIYGFHGGTPGYYFSLDNTSFQPVLNDSVVINNLDVGEYVVYIRDINGCPHIDTFNIGVDMFIPNLISPNGDNHNDVFEIIALPRGSELRIFNRWGSRVYYSKDYDNLWAGSNEPDGVYYFELVLPNNELYKGWVEIIR